MVPTTNVTVNEQGSSDISVRGGCDKRLMTVTIAQTIRCYDIRLFIMEKPNMSF